MARIALILFALIGPTLFAEDAVSELSRRPLTTFSADAVLPHFVAGIDGVDTWTTTIFLVNISTKEVKFDVRFWKASDNTGDKGLVTKFQVDGQGTPETTDRYEGKLLAGGSMKIETSEEQTPDLIQGWVEINAVEDVGIVAWFRRQRGGPVAEPQKCLCNPDYFCPVPELDLSVSLPISSRFDSSFVIPFENGPGPYPSCPDGSFFPAAATQLTTFALANPSADNPLEVCLRLKERSGDDIPFEPSSSEFAKTVCDQSKGDASCSCKIVLKERERKVFSLHGPGLFDKEGIVEFTGNQPEMAGFGLFAQEPSGSLVALHALTTIAK